MSRIRSLTANATRSRARSLVAAPLPLLLDLGGMAILLVVFISTAVVCLLNRNQRRWRL